MTVSQVCLNASDAVEFGETLEFIRDWLMSDRDRLAESLRCFVEVDGYDIDQLRADLSRFGFLLDVSDGELLFDGDER